ncbi:MAG: hypothetical protein N3D18_12140 [Roseococcus sp.]|nr:hypothetical protein [Roseococcus sp.]
MTAGLQGVWRERRAAGRAVGLGLLLALGACADLQGPRLPGPSFGAFSFGPQWGGTPVELPSNSLTVQRVRGRVAAAPETLQPEPGSIWPAQEAPRATLADPEEVLRGASPPRRPVGSSTAPDLLEPPRAGLGRMPRLEAAPAGAPAAPPRSDGQAIPTPSGPVVTTGGAGRVQSTLSPQGPGLAIREGASTTLLTPGEPPRQVPTPR